MSRPDLYLSGTTISPGFENAREGIDIPVANGLVKPGTTSFGTQLVARNDHGGHYSIEPVSEMTLTAYTTQLQHLNSRAEKYLSSTQGRTGGLALPKQSRNKDKATRFIFNALASVVHENIPVPKISDWDDSDYTYLAVLAQSLEDGSLPLSDLVWDPEDVLKKEKVFTAAAVAAYMEKEETARLGMGDEDDESDLANDHALLRTVLEFDDARNPLAEKYA
ncbi:uncharacterized protein FOMMEDRAFT_93112 [Fomitiporia mediterranea MF3/22]|uniref:uncharacterized protein n=1 Tax=Fomitiporia mediterranea (strain MF3/22) TaxID=694068 RepID=UPI0004407C06|nr:uncharacterized protein FOMMEDRAFT_93112 [Fomitiporia mediterranea MF3/22]EJC99820.1 hypothetical protein FOMMEDRAFT_93112 [Fomitiporia mediterranea MF3/22]